MAVYAYAIVSSAAFKTWMGISGSDDDTIIEYIANGVTDWIESYCNRRIVARSADITETWDGDGSRVYFVEHPPINGDVTSITVENHATIDPTDTDQVRVEAAIGKITLLQDYFADSYPQNCEIEYNGGYSTVPADMWLAAAKLMKLVYLMRDANRELIKSVSNSLTGETTHYFDSVLTPDIRDVLDRYVMRRMTL